MTEKTQGMDKRITEQMEQAGPNLSTCTAKSIFEPDPDQIRPVDLKPDPPALDDRQGSTRKRVFVVH